MKKKTQRGRPPVMCAINVKLKQSTRDELNRLKRKLGLTTQAEVIETLLKNQ